LLAEYLRQASATTTMPRPLRSLLFASLAFVAFSMLHETCTSVVAAETLPGCCGEQEIKPRPLDQVWLISTRCLGCPSADVNAVPRMNVWLHEGKTWRNSSVTDFLAAQSPERRLIFHLHGARTEHGEATWRGYEFYRRLTAAAPAEEPISFVIWSWPTSPAGRPLRDLLAMASRSDVEACYLAWLVARIDPAAKVDLHGFSYGARAATGAMHLLSGGRLLGRTVSFSQDSARLPIDAVLWTPALNNDWLIPGRYHGQAIESMDRMLIVFNPCDRAMKHYHLTMCGRPQGLGYTGLWGGGQLGDAGARIEQWNGSGQLGSEHSFLNHMDSQRIMSLTQAFLFPAPVVTPAQAATSRH
jgi:hypothetical protein